MKGKFKQWLLSYDVGNPGFILEQTQTCVGVKPDNGIRTLPSWYLDPQQQCIHKQTITKLHRFASSQ